MKVSLSTHLVSFSFFPLDAFLILSKSLPHKYSLPFIFFCSFIHM